MKIAIVVQRYGLDVVGGAESYARQIAEKLFSSLGWDITVVTTTAKDYTTWKNHYPVGDEIIHGVHVKRFDSECERSRYFGLVHRIFGALDRRLKSLFFWSWIKPLFETLWIRMQGPYSPSLVSWISKHELDFERIFFVTYLYYPTIRGIEVLKHPERAVMIPTAHDEFPFYFSSVKKSLAKVHRILGLTKPELDLIASLDPSFASKFRVAGLGFDEIFNVSNETAVTSNANYMLYLGRISPGKGVAQLIQYFRALRAKNPKETIELHLAGKIEDMELDLKKDTFIKYHGFVSEEQKIQLIQNARIVVNPSAFESFSMIVLEAVALRKPVLVNRRCEVLNYYTKETSTVFGFNDEVSFVEVAQKCMSRDWTTESSLKDLTQSRDWSLSLYSWDRILGEFENC